MKNIYFLAFVLLFFGTADAATIPGSCSTPGSCGDLVPTFQEVNVKTDLNLIDADGSNYMGIKSPAVVTADTILTLPDGAGANGEILTTDGSGNLSWSAIASGLWTGSGSDVYFNTGNVGVGITSPAWKLDVVAPNDNLAASFGADIDGGVGEWTGVAIGHTGGNPNLYKKSGILFETTDTGSAKGKMHLAVNTTSDNSNVDLSHARLTISETGKVGVGTTTPESDLTVKAATGSATGGISVVSVAGDVLAKVRATSAVRGVIELFDENDTAVVDLRSYNDAATLMLNNAAGDQKIVVTSSGDSHFNAGNVGVGTDAPIQALHVVGQTRSDRGSNQFAIHDADGDPLASLSAIGNGTDDSASLRFNATNAAGSFAPVVTFDGSTGNMGVGTTSPAVELDVNTGTINAAAICDEDNANCIDLSAGVSSGGKFVDGTSAANAVYTTGNVGIGTAAPIANLEISDEVDTAISLYVGNSSTTNATGLYFNRFGSTTAPMGIQGTVAGVGIGDISLQAQGGRIGIGTTSPAHTLDVLGPIQSFATGTNDPSFYLNDVGNTQNWRIHNDISDNNNLHIRDGDSFASAISVQNGTNNVGIGSSAPANRLTVTTAQSGGSDEGITIQNTANGWGGSLTFNIPNNGGYDTAQITSVNSGSGGRLELKTADASGVLQQSMMINADGNVGIGTNAPGYKLQVSGVGGSNVVSVFEHDSTYAGISLKNSGSTTSPTIFSNNNDLSLWTNGSGRLHVTEAGNVGIGTGTPSEKLVVNGNTQVLESMAVGGGITGTYQMAISARKAGVSGIGDYQRGLYVEAAPDAALWDGGTSNHYVGGIVSSVLANAASGTNTFTSTEGMTIQYGHYTGSTATIDNTYGLRVAAYNSAGTTGNMYDLYLQESTGGTITGNHYGIYQLSANDNYFAGNVGIGINVPTHPLHMGSGAHVTTAGIWTNASDRAYKSNIRDIEYNLEDVMNLRPVSYTHIETDTEQIGFIAQEVEVVMPELVSGEDGEMGMSYGQMTAALVKAVQEQQAQIELLKNEIKTLKN